MTGEKLPDGKLCKDCIHFKQTCEWLISLKGTETNCDWNPSTFKEVDMNHTMGLP